MPTGSRSLSNPADSRPGRAGARHRTAAAELHELELVVAGYFPRLGGSLRRRSLRRGLYALLQARAHRAISRRFLERAAGRSRESGRVRGVRCDRPRLAPGASREATRWSGSLAVRIATRTGSRARADVTDADSLHGLLREGDVVVYLVHSPRHVRLRARRSVGGGQRCDGPESASARRIVYLGGLGGGEEADSEASAEPGRDGGASRSGPSR